MNLQPDPEPEPTRRFRGLLVLGLLCSAVIPAALAWPLLQGEVYVAGDLGNFHLPIRHFFSMALASGHETLWLPHQYTGFYLHGEGQAALTHPLNWLSYRFLPLSAAFSLEWISNYLLLWLGTFLLLRRWRMPRVSAVLGAILFSFSSFNMLHYTHLNFLAISAHLPFLLLLVDIALLERNRRREVFAQIGLSLVIASELLKSHPQMTWMTLLAGGLYGLFILGRERSRLGSESGIELIGVALRIGVSIGLAFLLAGVQLLPQWDALGDSFRNAPSAGFTDSLSLHPANLLQWIAPYLFDARVVGVNTSELSFYVGAASAPLLTWALMRRKAMGSLWPITGFALTLSVLALLLSMGESAQLYRLQQALPIIGLFRAPARYLLLAEFGIAIASAAAFADLLRCARSDRIKPLASLWPLALPPLLSLLLSLSFFLALESGALGSEFALASWPRVAVGMLLVSIASLAVASLARHSSRAAAFLILFTTLDLAGYGLSYVRLFPTTSLDRWISEIPTPRLESGQRVDVAPPVFTMRGIRLAGGYSALVPDRMLPIGDPHRSRKNSPLVLRSMQLASVAWSGGTRIEAPLPRARLLGHAHVSDRILRDLLTIDIENTALIAEPIDIAADPLGQARILRDDPGDIEIETRSTTPQLLVLAESFHAGWTASRDAENCRILRVYGDFMGCRVGPGIQHVHFRFQPESFRIGSLISWLGLGGLCAWSAFLLWRVRGGKNMRTRSLR